MTTKATADLLPADITPRTGLFLVIVPDDGKATVEAFDESDTQSLIERAKSVLDLRDTQIFAFGGTRYLTTKPPVHLALGGGVVAPLYDANTAFEADEDGFVGAVTELPAETPESDGADEVTIDADDDLHPIDEDDEEDD